MATFLALILEKFTIEIIPKLPISIRTQLYLNILKLRKVRDRLRFDATSKSPTFQERLNYAIDSRANLNNSGFKCPIPIVNNQILFDEQPDYILLLAWHLATPIMKDLKSRGIKSKFIIPLPNVEVLD